MPTTGSAAVTTDRPRLLMLNIGHFQTHYFLLVYPTAALALEHAGAGRYGDLLMPATAGFVGYAVGTLPAGWLGDRVRRESLLVGMFAGQGAAALLLGLFADTPLALVAGLALVGLFAAVYHPVGIPLVAESAPPGRTGRVLGVNGVWGNLGVAAAPIVTAWLATAHGWRAAFVVPGLAALASAVAQWWVARPAAGGRSRIGRAAATPSSVDASAATTSDQDVARVMGFLVLGSLFGGVTFSVLTVVLPKAIDSGLGVRLEDATGAAGLAALVFTVAAFSQVVSGRLIDQRPLRRVLMTLACGELLACLVLAAAPRESGALALLPLAVCVFAGIPVYDAAAAGAVASRWRARLFAVKYLLSLAVGAAAVPLVATLYTPEQGFAPLYALLATCSAGLLASALLLPAGFGPAAARMAALRGI